MSRNTYRIVTVACCLAALSILLILFSLWLFSHESLNAGLGTFLLGITLLVTAHGSYFHANFHPSFGVLKTFTRVSLFSLGLVGFPALLGWITHS